MLVLNDGNISELLHSLERDDVLKLLHNLAKALHMYSSTDEGEAIHQPIRTTIRRSDGRATLFMPAADPQSAGVKVVTLSAPAEPGDKKEERIHRRLEETDAEIQAEAESTSPAGTLTLLTPEGRPLGLLAAATLTAFRTALASCILLVKRTNVRTLTVFGAGAQAYWHIRLALLIQPSIHKVNIINRSFSRAARLMKKLLKDYPVPGSTAKFQSIGQSHVEYPRLLKEEVRAADVIFCCTPSTDPLFPASFLTNPEGRKKTRLLCLIGSYMPHMHEVPPEIIRAAIEPRGHHHGHAHGHAQDGAKDGHHHKHLSFKLPHFGKSSSSSSTSVDDSVSFPVDSRTGSTASSSETASLVGSNSFSSTETGATTPRSSLSSISFGSSGSGGSAPPPLPQPSGAILVDSLSHCLVESGELISAGVTAIQCVELGELCMLKKAALEEQDRALAKARSESPSGSRSGSPSRHGSTTTTTTTTSNSSTASSSIRSSSRDRRKKEKKQKEEELAERRKRDGGLLDWLERGNIVYKSVGMGLMDITVGRDVIELARSKKIGVEVGGF